MVEPYKPLYTIKEASIVLKVNVSTMYEICNSGQIPYLILGHGSGSRRIRGIDLEKFINNYPVAEVSKKNIEASA